MANEYRARAEKIWKTVGTDRNMTGHRHFLGYAWAVLRSNPIYTHWSNLLTYFRRFRMIGVILRVTSVMFAVLETGALVILSTVVFLILLPIVGAFVLGVLATALIESRRTNRVLRQVTEGRSICILFLREDSGRFFEENVKSLVGRGYVVIVLSPYLISKRGLWNRHFYCTAARLGKNVFLARRYYYFSLRKHVLGQRETVYVY